MITKRTIFVEFYGKDFETTWDGRLIGLIDEQEFCGLIKHKELQKTFLDMETMSLEEIAEDLDIEGLRLLMTAKKINDKTKEKTLVVTEPLYNISYMKPKNSKTGYEIGITSDKSYIMIKEKVTI